MHNEKPAGSRRKHWRTCARSNTASTSGLSVRKWPRVNFLPLEQRKQYLYDILDHARRHGVKSGKPADGAT